MKVLVTGATGFIGKNLCVELHNISEGKGKPPIAISEPIEVYEYNRNTDDSMLEQYVREADYIFHFAAVHRPIEEEYIHQNVELTKKLVAMIEKNKVSPTVVFTSSIQVHMGTIYGQCKRLEEEVLAALAEKTGAKVYIYRLSHVFGKWNRPNYNSVVATFCYNIARGLPISISDRNTSLNLLYIDDVVREFLCLLAGQPHLSFDGHGVIEPVYPVTLGEIVDLLYSFRHSREERSVPDMEKPFVKKLYSTYLSYLPEDEFSYPLKMNCDERGSFTEIIRTKDRGQVSVNISKPHIVKGNHWHHTKNEKFVVVKGTGVIRFRQPDSEEVIEYFVSGDKIEVVDIPTGYTHNIENLGEDDMVTIMWANECFDPEHPDTYYLEV